MTALRAMLFFLCFTVDVTVRAESFVVSVRGKVELENKQTQQAVLVTAKTEIPKKFRLEVQKKSQFRFKTGFWIVGVGANTLLESESSVGSESLKLAMGTLWIQSQVKKPTTPFRIETPQGVIEVSGNSFVKVTPERTTVDVVAGQTKLQSRIAESQFVELAPGYTNWIGGIQLEGNRAFGEKSALSGVELIKNLNQIAGLTEDQISDVIYLLKNQWQEAVRERSAAIKQEIIQEVADQIKKEDSRRAAVQKASQEKKRLREMFRAKVFGVPEMETESPSASDRSPASDPTQDNTEYSDKAE